MSKIYLIFCLLLSFTCCQSCLEKSILNDGEDKSICGGLSTSSIEKACIYDTNTNGCVEQIRKAISKTKPDAVFHLGNGLNDLGLIKTTSPIYVTKSMTLVGTMYQNQPIDIWTWIRGSGSKIGYTAIVSVISVSGY
jgi:hypothetical protein